MRARAGLAFVAVVAFATTSRAELAAPQVSLTVTPGSAGGPWKITIANGGDVPVRLAADPRLITLTLDPQAPTKTVTRQECTLPADARPATDEGRELVVPGKRAWSATFDPLFYCFGAKQRALLVPGTTVTVHFGFPPPKAKKSKKKKRKAVEEASKGPWVAYPVGAAVGKVGPLAEIVAPSFVLGEAVTAAPPPSSAAAASESTEEPQAKPPLVLTTNEAVDVARGVDVPLTITVANVSDRSVTTFFRSSTIAVRVIGPGGSVSCGSPRSIAEPFRELFTTIAPKQKASTTINVDALCPAGTFDDPGVYRVIARLDTRGTSGKNVGLRTWDGEVSAATPTLVRVRTQHHPTTPTKPQLD